MADITMCDDGKNCPLHEKCYRYNATPERWQSYSEFYKYKENEECEYFWNMEEE